MGGKVKSIVGLVNGDRFPYLENVVYSYDEQPEKIAYGNGVVNTYHYTEALRRMKNLNIMSRRDTYLDNTYRYDKVGNITRISNRAGVTNNMLGNYNNTYVYDVLNRLSGAEGGFEGDRDVPSGDSDSRYSLSMKYNNTYGIVQKKQEHYKNDHSFLPNTYQNDYTYYGGTHRLKEIVDQNTHHTQNFEYDDNGNLKIKISNNDERRLYWDESNRLRVVEMDHNMQHYIYDAAGERVLKANTAVESIYENGQLTGQSVNIDSYTMYPSGYLVYTNDGRYTKHYYMGTTRIATQVGDGHIRTRAQAGEDVQKLQNLQKADLADILRQSKNFKKVTYNKREPVAFADDEEKDTDTLRRPSGNVYFYHPDHLGTATLLTDISGDPYQFFLNLPFGEEMASQHSTTADFSSRYKFNGKELDRETGWYYYGARYYDPQVSTWLSVDPLAEKYIGFSPYNFTLGNPVRLVDVDGKKNEDWIKNLKTGKYKWDNNVTSKETTPEGYKYIGKKDVDIVNDLFKKSSFSASDYDIGFTTFASSDRGAAAHHFYARTKMQINLRANTSISNKNGIVSKKFNGIDIFVDIIPYRVAPTLTEKNPDLSSVKLQGIKMHMNNSTMYSVIPKRATFFSTGEISALHMKSFIPAKVISSNFPSSHFLEFSFKGLYYQDKTSLSRYPFVTVNNYTYLNKTITYTND